MFVNWSIDGCARVLVSGMLFLTVCSVIQESREHAQSTLVCKNNFLYGGLHRPGIGVGHTRGRAEELEGS